MVGAEVCISYFSIAVTKCDTVTKIKNRFIVASSARGIRTHCDGEAWRHMVGVVMGVVAHGRHGDGSRKLRVHIFSDKQEAEGVSCK